MCSFYYIKPSLDSENNYKLILNLSIAALKNSSISLSCYNLFVNSENIFGIF